MTPTTNAGGAPDGDAHLVSIAEAASLSGLSVRTIQQAIQHGDLAACEIQLAGGRAYRVAADAVDRLACSRDEALLQHLQQHGRHSANQPRRPTLHALPGRHAARGLVLLALVALATAAVPAAAAWRHPAAPPALRAGPTRPSATLDTSFTLTAVQVRTGRHITVRGHVTVASGVTRELLAVLDGCPLPATRARRAPGGVAGGMSMGAAQVSAPPTMPLALTRRLQQWGTSYSVLLSLDQAPTTGVAPTQGQRGTGTGQEMALWMQLRHALGAGYVVQSLREQRVRTIDGLASAGCAGSPVSHVLAIMTAARARARGALRRWLDTTWRAAIPCLGSYDTLTADVASMMRGETDPSVLTRALAREAQACARIAVPPIPHPLAHSRTAHQAVAALTRAVVAGQLAIAALAPIDAGDTNACSVQHVVGQLRSGTHEARTYVHLIDRLKRAYALEIPRTHGRQAAAVTLPPLPASCPPSSG